MSDTMRSAVRKACNETLGSADAEFFEAVLIIKQILRDNEDMCVVSVLLLLGQIFDDAHITVCPVPCVPSTSHLDCEV
jgi:hypothetical protein